LHTFPIPPEEYQKVANTLQYLPPKEIKSINKKQEATDSLKNYERSIS
jgi:hypothetical protein